MAATTEYHVASNGDDLNDGTSKRPLRTISEAAKRAQPGDTITVHRGLYREWVAPPRGGDSPERPIVYQAAPGEHVEIRGSEVVKGWEKVQGDTWKAVVPNTFFGGYSPFSDLIHGDWFDPKGREHHTAAVYLDGDWLWEAASLEDVLAPQGETPYWFAQVGDRATEVWAQFRGADPNLREAEVNVRPAVFYPDHPGVNYVTVRGFTLRHAATQWAPPTAEQPGLIGTHWSKGWVIEDNTISHSRCVGIALGKYGDEFDNTSQDTAEGYVLTIDRALKNGWNGDQIGHHVVRSNVISQCEQAGIVGSLGAIYSVITGNQIHDIHVQRQFGGAEMAGIKLHAAIDTEISGNRIYRTVRGIWLDWMAQGTMVSRNLLYMNASEDLFVEVNHGPFVVANNLFFSKRALLDVSEGGAYVHNLFGGPIAPHPELNRETPFHPAHSTEVAGLSRIEGGDDRFYNNLFMGSGGLSVYDSAALPVLAAGNVYIHGAQPLATEKGAVVLPDYNPLALIREVGEELWIELRLDRGWGVRAGSAPVTTATLGRAKIPNLPYAGPDGAELEFDTDYNGVKRGANPMPGPFEVPEGGQVSFQMWPRATK